MSKKKKVPSTIDPNEVYKSIRKPMPPPTKVITHKKKYKRSEERKKISDDSIVTI